MARVPHVAALVATCVTVALCATPALATQNGRTSGEQTASSATTNRNSKTSKDNSAKTSIAPSPAAESMPPSAPTVIYTDGVLLVDAQNSTLADVLAAIGKQTGATVEIPSGLSERIAVRLGPSQPRQIIADLLRGAGYDYVMVGSSTDPEGISSLVLTRSSGTLEADNTVPPKEAAPAVAEADPLPPKGPLGAENSAEKEARKAAHAARRQAKIDAFLAMSPEQRAQAEQAATAVAAEIPQFGAAQTANVMPTPEQLDDVKRRYPFLFNRRPDGNPSEPGSSNPPPGTPPMTPIPNSQLANPVSADPTAVSPSTPADAVVMGPQ